MTGTHVVPRNDVVAHDLVWDCLCGPDIEAVKAVHPSNRWTLEWLIVHHAADGRD